MADFNGNELFPATTGTAADVAVTSTANTFTANQVISVASSDPALKITQAGSGAALQLQSSGVGGPQIKLVNDANDSESAFWSTQKTRAGAAVQLNDKLGTFYFRGADINNATKNSAFMTATVDGNPGSGYIPTRLSFRITNTSGSYVSPLSLVSSGNVGINYTAPSAQLHVIKTTEQLRLGYDTTKYLSATVDSSGNCTLDCTGGTIKTPDAIENTTSGEGIILKSPDGTRYKLTVANGGTLSITAA